MRHSRRPLASIALVAVVALAAFAGCRNATEPQATLLSVVSGAGNVTLTNRTDETVAYRLGTERFFALADPAPCPPSDAPCGPTIAPRGRVLVAYAQIGGYAPGERSAVLLDWTVRDPHVSGTRTERLTIPLR